MDRTVDTTTRYLTIPQAAVYLGFSPKHLYRLVQERRIPFIRKGKMILFDKSALDQWMVEDTVPPLSVWK